MSQVAALIEVGVEHEQLLRVQVDLAIALL